MRPGGGSRREEEEAEARSLPRKKIKKHKKPKKKKPKQKPEDQREAPGTPAAHPPAVCIALNTVRAAAGDCEFVRINTYVFCTVLVVARFP